MKYEVKLYYAGFVTHTVEAETPERAIQEARKIQDQPYGKEEAYFSAYRGVIDTLQPWPETDYAEVVETGVRLETSRTLIL